jgi:2-polyprenyl-3-methyl-5-hydroxy-6-metoxy-1,4-benzoquinol methylase
MDEDAYQAYRSVVESLTLRSIWASVYGNRFWSDVDPPWTLATLDDVHFVAECLCPKQISRLVDFGCGSGALVRFLARDFGAQVEGLDTNPNAIRLARERSGDTTVSSKTAFLVGEFGAIEMPDGTFDGAASLDVLLFVPDKAKALREVARLLRPNACFAGTTFELGSPSAALATTAFVDYPGAFVAAGFNIEVYEEAVAWRELLEGVTSSILAREPEISCEIHSQALSRVLRWARTRPSELADSRRVRFCVRKPL